MATAAQLTATSTVINGLGLAPNVAFSTAITTYQAQSSVKLMANIFTNAYLASNVANVIVPVLNTLGSGQIHGMYLIDLYPANITPVVTTGATIGHYGNALVSFSKTISSQATAPFASGMAGFANAFITAQGYASSAFDTVASISMLQGKTYGQSGLGFTGPVDLLTGGVGGNAHILGQTIATWGTMYDIKNLNLIGDTYVFGENLLKQNLGTYGNLSGQLAATGLVPPTITNIPLSKTTATPTVGNVQVQTSIGSYPVTTVSNVITTTTVTGNNPNVVIAIYNTITGSNLDAILTSTQFKSNSTQLKTLGDYLDFNKVVDPILIPQLKNMGITTLSEFGAYLHNRIGQKTFKSWADASAFLSNVQIPNITTTANANTPILPPAVASSLLTTVGTGSGPFGNPVMTDFFGVTAGMSTANLTTINTNYSSTIGALQSAMFALDQAVYDTYLNYQANTQLPANVGMVTANVATVNATLASLSANTQVNVVDTAYYSMLNKMSTEVANLTKAGTTFGAGSSRTLLTFGQRIGSLAAVDKTGIGSDVVINALITPDANGDTIHAVVVENNNSAATTNNPNPQHALAQAQAQGVPLSTYLSQNQ